MTVKRRASATLSAYIAKQYVVNFCTVMFGLLSVILLFEVLELLRRAEGRTDAGLLALIQLGMMKLPDTGQEAFPFAVLFAGMFTFWRLTRSQELIIARASGLSVWQFIAPVLAATVMIGVVAVTVLNPIGAILMSRFDAEVDRVVRGRAYTIDVARTGLWLREDTGDVRSIVHASRVNMDTLEFQDVIVFFWDQEHFLGRLDAGRARLVEGRDDTPGYWAFTTAWLNEPDRPARMVSDLHMQTSVKAKTIMDSFASPDAISFWALPRLIRTMEATGFSAVSLRIHFQALLAQPLLFAAIILIAAAASLRLPRRGGTLMMIGGGIASGFGFYLLSKLVLTLGQSEQIPVLMAAWIPALVTALAGTAALLYLEDG
jgi:lipopolysaccharide export system permease protein